MNQVGVISRRILPWLGVALLVYAVIRLSYLNQWTYQYLVPPGGDGANHARITETILNGGIRLVATYHILWHLLTAWVAKIYHLNSITAMAYLAPGLLVSGSVAMFIFNKKFFGWSAGVVTLILFGLMSRQPIQTLTDGGFPNVLAAATVLPLTLAALIIWYEKPRKVVYGLLFFLMLLVLLYSHHITTLYALPIIGIFMAVQFVFWLKRRGVPAYLAIFVFPVLYLLLVILAKLFLSLHLGSSSDLTANIVRLDWSWPFIHLIGRLDNPHAWLPITSYPEVLGEAVVWLGALGAVAAIGYFLINGQSRQGRAALILLLWGLIVLAGSQTEAIGFPIRLSRDLAIPLCLLAGLFFQAIADFCRPRGLSWGFPVVAIIIGLLLGLPSYSDRLAAAQAPSELIYYTEADNAVVEYMNKNLPANVRVVVFQDNFYIPLFARRQRLVTDIPESRKLAITDPAKFTSEFANTEYVYFEYWPTRPQTWNNNRANLNSYLASKEMRVVTSRKTKEKEVYLFRVTNVRWEGE